jgi:hypothetical protein
MAITLVELIINLQIARSLRALIPGCLEQCGFTPP